MTPDNPRKALTAEIKRLKVKLQESSDKDIKKALGMVLQEREAELEKLGGPEEEAAVAKPEAVEEPEEPETLPEAPTPEALEQAEKLIAQSRLEKRRENTTRAKQLLDEALRVAAGSSAVQELVADNLLEQRESKAALRHYLLACKLDPKNVSADKKHAQLVFNMRAKSASSDMMLEYSRDQMVTSSQKAMIFSLVLPGSGQILLGENTSGGFLMGGWLSMVFWILFWNEDIYGILHAAHFVLPTARPPAHPPNYLVLLPVFVALILHAISVFSAWAEGAGASVPKIEHPAPPVDLPFE